MSSKLIALGVMVGVTLSDPVAAQTAVASDRSGRFETLDAGALQRWRPGLKINCPPGWVGRNVVRRAGHPDAFRFTVAPGDQWAADARRSPPRDRCEFDFANDPKTPFDTPTSLAVSFRWPCGQPLSRGRVVYIGQLHASDDRADVKPSWPALAFKVQPNGGGRTKLSLVYSGSTDGNRTISGGSVHVEPDMACGRWYDWLVTWRYSAKGDGAIQAWRRLEGADQGFRRVADASAINFGYDDARGPYFKIGLYTTRGREAVSVDYVMVEFPTTRDLSGLLKCPSCWRHPE